MSTLLLILRLFPTIIATVQALQVVTPLPNDVQSRIDLLMGTVSEIYDAEQSLQNEITKDKLLPLIKSLITRVSALFHPATP